MSRTDSAAPRVSTLACAWADPDHDGEGEEHDVDQPVARRAPQVPGAVRADAALDRRQQRPLPAGHRGVAGRGGRHRRLKGKRPGDRLKSLAPCPEGSAAHRPPAVARSGRRGSMLPSMIEAHSLTKRYGDRAVVHDVSFTCEPGTVTGFLGLNGAGKSTTLKMLCGLTPVTGGDAAVLGAPYARHPNPGRRIGVLIDASAQHAGRRGREVLGVSAQLLGVDTARVDQLLALVGLDRAAARKRVGQYSLGMRQRLGIAHALLGDPEVLILDEPANGLDPDGMRWMRGLLRDFAATGWNGPAVLAPAARDRGDRRPPGDHRRWPDRRPGQPRGPAGGYVVDAGAGRRRRRAAGGDGRGGHRGQDDPRRRRPCRRRARPRRRGRPAWRRRPA